ncbi:MAG TPA: hypothetical protein VK203_17435 [Nostocaceae cyanobacterium]|nr:hypothetical protein [Nostocaceae cyanobacterium]
MSWPLSNYFLIAGVIFFAIAVLGNVKFLFLEINPGCFGRSLALILGCLSFVSALIFFSFPAGNLDMLLNDFTQTIQQGITAINQVLVSFLD